MRKPSESTLEKIIQDVVKERDVWKNLAISLQESIGRKEGEVEELRSRIRYEAE